MNQEIPLRIILESPPPGCVFGIQKGSGSKYETLQKQMSDKQDLQFDFTISVKAGDTSSTNFLGPFVQGPPAERFIYIDIGTYAGQADTAWSRRLKIPLKDISPAIIKLLLADPNNILETKVPGTGKDGGPNCATVKPFAGWHVTKISK